jgi:hypothetical protein
MWARVVLVAFSLLAIARGLVLVRHEPLLAFANSYDQIRYSSCLDLAPWRPGVPTDRANPPAPYPRFAFQPLTVGNCMWTSDLLLTAPVALGWRISEQLGGRTIHSVRRLAEFRLLIWFAMGAWATWFFLRERRTDLAVAHLAWFAFVAMDPANTLYLATFYAEAAAVLALYVCGVGTVAALVRPTRTALTVAALGALLLATSKFQHLVLPILLGVAIAAGAGRAGRRVALVLIAVGAVGCVVQLANGSRSTPMAHSVGMANRADFLLSVLLKETSDRERVTRALDLDEACLGYVGKSIYAMPGPVEKTCTNVGQWRRTTLWWLLISDPAGLGRALAHIPVQLLPWQPGYLGVVEDAHFGKLPPSTPSLSRALGRNVATAWTLLLLPWLVFAVCAVRRASPLARGFALACAVGAASVPLVALLGDGDVEYAKHAHLTINFALASLCIPLAAAFRRSLRPELAP